MQTRETIMPLTVAIVIGVTTFLSSMPAFAQTPTSTVSKNNFFDDLSKFIADKFHLNQNQVTSALEEYHTKHQTVMQQQREDRQKARLDQLVKDGKITKDQENAIIAELASLRTKYNLPNMKNLTQEERQQKLEAMQTELQNWAKDHSIDLQYLKLGFGMGEMHMGMMRHGDFDDSPANITKPTQ